MKKLYEKFFDKQITHKTLNAATNNNKNTENA